MHDEHETHVFGFFWCLWSQRGILLIFLFLFFWFEFLEIPNLIMNNTYTLFGQSCKSYQTKPARCDCCVQLIVCGYSKTKFTVCPCQPCKQSRQ